MFQRPLPPTCGAPFHVVPHLGNPTMGQAARLIVERYSTELDLRALTDRQSLLVRDGGTTMLQS